MPDSPGDQNAFPLRELEVPLHRAAEVKSRHGLWVADPSSPDGGQGPGYHVHFSWRRAREEAWQSFQNAIPVWGLYRNRHRYHNVLYALNSSTAQAGGLMLEESGASLDKILTGLLPSLVDLAKWVGLGGLLGGGLGALGGPFDEVTVPAGAVAGAEIGLFIANSLGLAGLLVGVMENLGSFVQYAGDATEIAWYAGGDPHVPEASDLSSAEKLFAFALAELWMALLQALIAEVLRRVGKNLGDKIAKSEAINAVAKKIGESKLGSATGEWFQKNFDKINEAVEKRKAALRTLGEQGDSASGAEAEGPSSESTPASPKKAPPVPRPTTPFDDLAERRKTLGLPPAGAADDDATLARLQLNGKTYDGINRGYQDPPTPMTLDRVNAQTITHAEADAVQKAVLDGAKGTSNTAEMWVDRDPCTSCGKFAGLRSLARNLGVDRLIVNSPSGTQVFTPTK
jgi:hypothetical protein